MLDSIIPALRGDSLAQLDSPDLEWTAHVAKHFTRLSAAHYKTLDQSAREVARRARVDASLNVTADPRSSHTLEALLAKFRSHTADVAGQCAISGHEAAAKARFHTDLLEHNRQDQQDLLAILPPAAPHSRHLSPELLRRRLALISLFEALFTILAFSALHMGPRVVAYSLALLAAAIFVFAAHLIGSGLRTGPIHLKGYVIAGVVPVITAASIVGLTILRLLAARSHHNLEKAVAAIRTGWPRPLDARRRHLATARQPVDKRGPLAHAVPMSEYWCEPPT